MSTILRVKINEMTNNVSFIANDKISYYYDSSSKNFIFKNGNTIVSSNRYELLPDTWYILGYTYDSKKVNFYVMEAYYQLVVSLVQLLLPTPLK